MHKKEKKRIAKKKYLYFNFLIKYTLKKRLLLKYIIIVAAIICSSYVSIIQPEYQKKIIDQLTNVHKTKLLNIITNVILFLMLILVNYLLTYLQRYIQIIVSEDIAEDLRNTVNAKLTKIQSIYFSKNNLSDVLLKSDKNIQIIKQSGIISLITLITNLILLLCVIPHMFYIHNGITILTIILICMIPISTKIIGLHIKRATKKVLDSYKKITDILNCSYKNWINIRIFQCTDYICNKYAVENRTYKKNVNEQNELYILNTIMSAIFVLLGISAIWIWGTNDVYHGNMTIGTIFALINYQTTMTSPILGISSFANDYHTSYEAMNDFIEFMNLPDYNESGIILNECPKEIILENVSFRYDNSDFDVFSNVNIRFEQGKTYYFIGNSGQGKSTLFNLIIGFLHPTQGRILIDGYDLREINLCSYWKSIGYVMQNSYFFFDTIKQNIDLTNSLNEDVICSMADELNLMDTINNSKDGFHTIIKEDSSNFSGGQLKRFDILRNILKNPGLLILDEGTSNVETNLKERIHIILQRYFKNSIVICSTHDKNELVNADIIYIISNKHIEAVERYEDKCS